MHTGNLFIISAPSGAGKTSLISALLKQHNQIKLSISHTTRQPRTGEEDGIHYHFINQAIFDQMLTDNAFIEHATVFGNSYGTCYQSIETQQKTGSDVILEIDWQGAQQVRKNIKHCHSLFILPPSKKTLQQRLNDRGQDSEEIIAERMQQAISEMSHYHEFDFILINDDFQHTLQELTQLIQSLGFSQQQQVQKQQTLLKSLLS